MHNWEDNFDRIFFLENIVLLLIGNTTKMFGKKLTMILNENLWPVLFERVTVLWKSCWNLLLKSAASSPGCTPPFPLLLLHTGLVFPLILFPSILQPRFITLNCSSACLQHVPSACPIWDLPTSAHHPTAGQVSCCHPFFTLLQSSGAALQQV